MHSRQKIAFGIIALIIILIVSLLLSGSGNRFFGVQESPEKASTVAKVSLDLKNLEEDITQFEALVESQIESATADTQADWNAAKKELQVLTAQANDKLVELQNAHPDSWTQFSASAEGAVHDGIVRFAEIQKDFRERSDVIIQ